MIKLRDVRPRPDAGAVHAAVDVDKDFKREPSSGCGLREGAEHRLIIGDGGEARLRERLQQLNEPRDVWADWWIGEQHFLRAGCRGHLGLGDGGGLKFADALVELEPDDLGRLVRLHVRPQARRAAGHRDHPADVFADAVGVKEERRRDNVGFVGEAIPVGAHGFSSKIASISTAMFPGNDPMPTALRAPMPFSGPTTSAINSLYPLMTCGCWVKSGVALTMPSVLTRRLTRLSEPSCARSVVRIVKPTWRAASLP